MAGGETSGKLGARCLAFLHPRQNGEERCASEGG